MMLRTGPMYFYDQVQRKTGKRTKKMPEELPSDMKYLNPRLAHFINSLNKNKKVIPAQADKKEISTMTTTAKEMDKEKYALLPDIGGSNAAKNHTENHKQKLSQVFNDDEQFMNPFDDYKYIAPTLLYELGKLLNIFSQYEIIFPQGVVNVLNYSWQELIEGAVYHKNHGLLQGCKKTSETNLGPENNDLKGSGTAPLVNEDNIKSHKNKANTTLFETSKEKPGPEFAQTRLTVNKSPQNLPSHLPVTISFCMSSRACEDKGWIFQSTDSKSEDMEWKRLISWALERLQLAQIQINKQVSLLNERGFCKPIILQHYDTNKKDNLVKQNRANKAPMFALVNGKPRIPELKRDNPSLRKLHYALIDGSTMVYYPFGQLAVCQSYSGLSCGGYYTNIFSPQQTIIGTFTPFGHGSICLPESNVYVLQYNQVGGVMTDKEGETMKEWDWPKKGKISNPITLQVSEYFSIRIAGQFSISLIYRWQKETVHLSLSSLPDVPPPQMEDLGQLMTNENFSSKTAREMSKENRKKSKEKETKRSQKKTVNKMNLIQSYFSSNAIIFTFLSILAKFSLTN